MDLPPPSGLVMTRYSLQPSYSGPPKSVSGEVLDLQVGSHRAIKYNDRAVRAMEVFKKGTGHRNLSKLTKNGWISIMG
jgi:hypothetical protein